MVTGPCKIPNRFIRGHGWGDLGKVTCAQELGELARVTPIRLNVIAGLAGNERRRNHLAAHAPARECWRD